MSKVGKFKFRLKRFLTVQRARKHWKKRFQKVYGLCPQYRIPLDNSLVKSHKEFWRPVCRFFGLDTLRLCAAISGSPSIRLVPEDLFVAVIEPCLNEDSRVRLLEHKGLLAKWVEKGVSPEVFINCICGQFYDENFNLMADSEVGALIDSLRFPVTIKPSIDSYGGAGVYFPDNPIELRRFMEGQDNFVVQEYIRQHEFFDAFNHSGMNTIRVCVYKSFKDNRTHVINAALRMGVGGSLDNETQGGIVCLISPDGVLNKYSVDKYGKKFSMHPDTKIVFGEAGRIPKYSGLVEVACKVVTGLLLPRLVSLDMCLDSAGFWRVIEINLAGQTIRFAQYGGEPFFGSFTDEVVAFCSMERQTEKRREFLG